MEMDYQEKVLKVIKLIPLTVRGYVLDYKLN